MAKLTPSSAHALVRRDLSAASLKYKELRELQERLNNESGEHYREMDRQRALGEAKGQQSEAARDEANTLQSQIDSFVHDQIRAGKVVSLI